ncbi:YdaS family helix-turn-helix protein [Variovorax sp. dw_954]|uniref:transcriptional regulator n=1 Tax=Variovorax sp. dw_954 TaxID=2720078 RepID=UPI001BD43B1E|nr:YdaS family helix-turn-helix protein [Variovorax sp. dw_954]
MKLKPYLDAEGKGAATRLATAIGAHAPDVSDWANGNRPIPPLRATAIEKATKGKVMRWDCRPDDWHEHWPELARKKSAPPVPQRVEV